MKITRVVTDAAINQLAVFLEPRFKTRGRHSLGRPHGRDRLVGIRQHKRAELGSQKTRRMKRLELFLFANTFQSLSDVNECRHGWIPGPQQTRHPGPDVRSSDRLRRDVTCVPMILMTRMQDVTEVGLDVRADHRPAIKDLRDVLEAGSDFDVVDNRVDSGKSRDDFFCFEADFKRLVVFGVEGIRGRHAARHPQQNTGIGR